MAMATVKTKRWREQVGEDEGLRFLVSHYWPRCVKGMDAPWHDWFRPLAPSKHLHAARSGRVGPPISFEMFRRRYEREMESKEQQRLIATLARLLLAGNDLTLVCCCEEEDRCHRVLLKALTGNEVRRIEQTRRPAPYTGADLADAGAHR